jgi:hypothetical protein
MTEKLAFFSGLKTNRLGLGFPVIISTLESQIAGRTAESNQAKPINQESISLAIVRSGLQKIEPDLLDSGPVYCCFHSTEVAL